MSFEALQWALISEVDSPSQKVLLLILANYADVNHQAWPGIERLAEQGALSPRSVKRHLVDMETAGLLTKEARFGNDGARRTNIYTLAIPSRGQSDTPPGHQRSEPGATGGPITKEEPPEERTSPTPSGQDVGSNDDKALVDALFDEWWSLYPKSRRTQKADCHALWRKTCGAADVEAAQWMVTTLRRWLRVWENAGTEPQFIKQSIRWLRHKQWAEECVDDDAVVPPRARTGGNGAADWWAN